MNISGSEGSQLTINLHSKGNNAENAEGEEAQGGRYVPNDAGSEDFSARPLSTYNITPLIQNDDNQFDFYKSLLVSALGAKPSSEVLTTVSEYIERICQLSVSGQKENELKCLKKEVMCFFQHYLDEKMEKLFERLKQCFKSKGGSHKVLDGFISNFDEKFSSYSDSMKDVLWKVSLGRLKTTYNAGKLKMLIERLNDQAGKTQFTGKGFELEAQVKECVHVGEMIIKKIEAEGAGSARLSVVENFLNRLNVIIDRSVKLSDEHVSVCKSALKSVGNVFVSGIDGGQSSIPEYESLLVGAILNARYQAARERYPNRVPEKPPEEWTQGDFISFVRFFSATKEWRINFSREFKDKFFKLFHEGRVGVEFPRGYGYFDGDKGVGNWSDDEEDVSVELPYPYMDEGQLFAKFQAVAKTEVMALYYGKSEDQYWSRMVESIRGKRILDYYNARRCISVLASSSAVFRRQVIRNFLDTGEGEKKIDNRVRAILSSMSRHNIDEVTIYQSSNENKASFILWSKGVQVHIVKVPILSADGIPINSVAVELQLLLPGGEEAMKDFYVAAGYRAKSLEYFKPAGKLEFH